MKRVAITGATAFACGLILTACMPEFPDNIPGDTALQKPVLDSTPSIKLTNTIIASGSIEIPPTTTRILSGQFTSILAFVPTAEHGNEHPLLGTISDSVHIPFPQVQVFFPARNHSSSKTWTKV